MIFEYDLAAPQEYFYDITPQIRQAIRNSEVTNGFAIIYCPHTTAGITINENTDPDVIHDILLSLNKAYPKQKKFLHSEGNSAAHLKASIMGSSAVVYIEDGHPLLGTWQSVYFCEFDPPRRRTFYVKIFSN